MSDNDFHLKIASHMGATTNALEELKDDIREVKQGQETMNDNNTTNVEGLRVHIEGKMAECNTRLMQTLESRYMTRDAIREYVGKKISDKEKSIHVRLSLIVLGFMTAVGGAVWLYETSSFIRNLLGIE